jgi:16S rRNA (uracil1498-N3)-methyltransferase
VPRFPLESDPGADRIVRFGGADARHIAASLRVHAGDRLEASRPGRVIQLEVISASPGEVVARVVAEAPDRHRPAMELSLMVGVPKGQRMDLVVEKSAELGVATLRPVWCERCVVRAGDRTPSRLTRWQRIARETSVQCGRTEQLRVQGPLPYAEAIGDAVGAVVVLDPDAAEEFDAGSLPADRVAVVVGPEGGLSPAETALAVERGAALRRLRGYTLRCETAAIAAAALLLLGSGRTDGSSS